jgi:hypothetical protein
MAEKIGKKARKGSKAHKQQTGGRNTGYLGRGRDIDAAVDEMTTGEKKKK